MPASSPAPDLRDALDQVRRSLAEDLVSLFGHDDAQVRVEEDGELTLMVEGNEGRFELRWPPSDRLTRADGRLGAHARIAFELLLASQTPAEFFPGHRPSSPARRRLVFDALRGYIDETLGGNPYYDNLLIVERGPAMLVFGDDEYALVSEDGKHRGHGILHWKVKRLLAYALTDADEALA